jgi:hypothetical protein
MLLAPWNDHLNGCQRSTTDVHYGVTLTKAGLLISDYRSIHSGSQEDWVECGSPKYHDITSDNRSSVSNVRNANADFLPGLSRA